MITRLPLFPLRTVLFPGALLPLHIFEPRYRELLADLTARPAEDRLFGLLPPGEHSELPAPGTVGTVARLRGSHQLPDGRFNIVVGGERRFAFGAAAPAETSYLQGAVQWFDDQPEIQVPAEEEVGRLYVLGARYARAQHALLDRALDVDLPRDPALLTFGIAAFLEWEFETLQRFLEVRSVSARVARLLAALPKLVTSAEARAGAHVAARSNGHGSIS